MMQFKNSLKLSVMDELLSGVSKEIMCKHSLQLIIQKVFHIFARYVEQIKGLIICVVAAFHTIFHLGSPGTFPTQITCRAVIAATDFVDMCTQHAAFMAGRGEIVECIESLKAGICTYVALYYISIY